MDTTRLLTGAAAAAVLMLLGACGGGEPAAIAVGGGDVPGGATASSQAYGEFVGSLAADDRAEPLNLDKLQPPTSETDEPFEVG